VKSPDLDLEGGRVPEEVIKVATILADGTFGSAWLTPQHRFHLVYRLGEWTYPKVGRIFAFGTIDEALYSRDMMVKQRAAMLRCITSGWVRARKISLSTGAKQIEEFWSKYFSGRDAGSLPLLGTILCSELMPVEVLETWWP